MPDLPHGYRSATKHFTGQHVVWYEDRACLVCGAKVAHDNPACICTHHRYEPAHDPHLDDKVLNVLSKAYPEAVRLCVVFGCERRHAFWDSICRLRRAGHDIEGLRPWGYRLRKFRHDSPSHGLRSDHGPKTDRGNHD